MSRNEKGQFQRGTSGNLSGRPKLVVSVRDAARQHTALALECLVKATKKGSITAAGMLLDRGWGRPHQSIDMRMLLAKKLNELSVDELSELEDQLAAMTQNDEDGSSSDD